MRQNLLSQVERLSPEQLSQLEELIAQVERDMMQLPSKEEWERAPALNQETERAVLKEQEVPDIDLDRSRPARIHRPLASSSNASPSSSFPRRPTAPSSATSKKSTWRLSPRAGWGKPPNPATPTWAAPSSPRLDLRRQADRSRPGRRAA